MEKSKIGLYDDALNDLNKALNIEVNGMYYYSRGGETRKRRFQEHYKIITLL